MRTMTKEDKYCIVTFAEKKGDGNDMMTHRNT